MTIGYVVTWDGSASSAANPNMINQKVSRGLVGGVRDKAVDVPGRDGAWLFQERRGNRTIAVNGLLVSDSPGARHADVVQMAEWLDKTGYRRLMISDQVDRYWEAGLSTDPNPDEWKTTGKYTLTWTAKPYAYSIVTSQDCVVGATNAVQESFFIPDTVDAYPVVEITPRGGDLNGGFTLTANGDILTYSGTLLENDTITISSLNYTVTEGINTDLELTGVFSSGTIFPADVSGVFPVLVEGLNTWSVSWADDATTVDVCFTWRRRYR